MPSTSTKQGASPQEMTVQEKQETTPLVAPVGEKLHTNYIPATQFAYCKQGG